MSGVRESIKERERERERKGEREGGREDVMKEELARAVIVVGKQDSVKYKRKIIRMKKT